MLMLRLLLIDLLRLIAAAEDVVKSAAESSQRSIPIKVWRIAVPISTACGYDSTEFKTRKAHKLLMGLRQPLCHSIL